MSNHSHTSHEGLVTDRKNAKFHFLLELRNSKITKAFELTCKTLQKGLDKWTELSVKFAWTRMVLTRNIDCHAL